MNKNLALTAPILPRQKNYRIALDLLTSRKVRVANLISHRLPLAQFAEGVALMQQRAALKVYFQIAGEQ